MKSRQIEESNATNRQTTTRFATITLDPGHDGFYPESRAFLESANVTDEQVHYVDVLDDGTIVGLYELHGGDEEIRDGVERLPTVLSYDVTGSDPTFLYLHEESKEPARTLLTSFRSSAVVVDRPFEHRPDGTLRVTLIGEDDALCDAVEAISGVVDVHLEETGTYHPDLGDVTTLLTDRQRQILELAVDLGYYEVPRRITHEEMAAECGVSQSTVAEHLQKIEATVLPYVHR